MVAVPALLVLLAAVVPTVTVLLAFRQQHGRRQSRRNPYPSMPLSSTASSSLEQAQSLTPPPITLSQGGEFEGGEFFEEHHQILQAAWHEWYQQNQEQLPPLTNTHTIGEMIHPSLVDAIHRVRESPTKSKEDQVKNLFTTIIPDHVYSIPLLTRQGVRALRQHLDAASYHYQEDHTTNHTNATRAGIPTRRPNGMNRFGVIIDANVPGAVSYPELNTLIHSTLIREIMQPLAQMWFPQFTSRKHVEDMEESYAFTIRYQADEQSGDRKLNEHSDASLFTLNINLNDYDDSNTSYSGSSLYFVDPNDNHTTNNQHHHHVEFTPGMAVLHRGLVRHAAEPITEGERHNLVLWMFGKNGYVRIGEYPVEEQWTIRERWVTPPPSNQQRLLSWMGRGGTTTEEDEL